MLDPAQEVHDDGHHTHVSDVYSPIPEEAAKRTDTILPNDLSYALGIILHSYRSTQESGLTSYSDLALFISDITTDLRNSEHAKKVVAFAMQRLGLPSESVKGVITFFTQTRGLWQDLITQGKLQEEMGQRQTTQERENKKLELATFQQRLANYLFNIGYLRSTSPTSQTINLIANLLQHLGSQADSNVFHHSLGIFMGANAQAAMMRGFKDQGFYVFTPDPDNADDMKVTDLRGCDFAAISPEGDMYIVDSKGRTSAEFDSPSVTPRTPSQATIDHIMDSIRLHPHSTQHSGVLRTTQAAQPFTRGIEVALPVNPQYAFLGRIRNAFSDVFMQRIISQAAII